MELLKTGDTGTVVGMCCLDEMMNNSTPENVRKLKTKYIPPQHHGKKIILYAPTWDETASYRKIGEEILAELSQTDAFVIIKPHPLCVTSQVGSSGHNLADYLRIKFSEKNYLVVTETPYEVMPISDLIISDFSSISFEYCLLRKPVLLYEGNDYAHKIADMEQYDILKSCCYTFSSSKALREHLKSVNTVNMNKKQNMEILQGKYFANVGCATGVALNRLIERNIIIKNDKNK
jgi:CDP-glycerol glycerophosphotransferase (TagB/SpsB family)